MQRRARIDGRSVYIDEHEIDVRSVYNGKRIVEKRIPAQEPVTAMCRVFYNAVTRLLRANKVAWLIRISALFAYGVVLSDLLN